MSKVKVIHTAKELHQFRQKLNENFQTLGFVPTMGALHSGHVSLIKKSTEENDYKLISIFVNPKQFNNSEDLKQYPRTLSADLMLLEGLTNCVVFAPDEAELYPKNDGFIPSDASLNQKTFNIFIIPRYEYFKAHGYFPDDKSM